MTEIEGFRAKRPSLKRGQQQKGQGQIFCRLLARAYWPATGKGQCFLGSWEHPTVFQLQIKKTQKLAPSVFSEHPKLNFSEFAIDSSGYNISGYIDWVKSKPGISQLNPLAMLTLLKINYCCPTMWHHIWKEQCFIHQQER